MSHGRRRYPIKGRRSVLQTLDRQPQPSVLTSRVDPQGTPRIGTLSASQRLGVTSAPRTSGSSSTSSAGKPSAVIDRPVASSSRRTMSSLHAPPP